MPSIDNPIIRRAINALASNKHMSRKQRLYGGAWGVAILLPVLHYAEPPNFFIKVVVIVLLLSIPSLITEFTYHPLRREILRIIKRMRG